MEGKLWPVIELNEAPPPLVVPHRPVQPQGKPPSECDGFSCDDCKGYGCPWTFGEDDA